MDDAENILLGLASIVVLGIGAQWLAWRVKLPSILLLLAFGFIAGPGTGWLVPDEMFGDLLFPIVSLSVALILFEGSLSLKFSELAEVGRPLRNLLTVGVGVTWLIVTLAAHWILQFDFAKSLLLGHSSQSPARLLSDRCCDTFARLARSAQSPAGKES